MSEHNDIYRILESLDAAQRSAKQLPALFKPANTSPQISGKYPGRNATQGYLVGEGDDQGWGNEIGDSGADETPDGVSPDTQSFLDEGNQDQENPMVQAVHRRIAFTRPEWITKYGMDAIEYAIEEIVGDDWAGEEIGSSDVSHYIHMIGEYLRDRAGSREEMDTRRPFAEQGVSEGYPYGQHKPERGECPECGTVGGHEEDCARHPENKKQQSKEPKKKQGVSEGAGSVPWQAVVNALAAGYPDTDPADSLAPIMRKYGVEFDDLDRLAQQNGYSDVYAVLDDFDQEQGLLEDRDTATEDVLSSIKKKLGDYLQDVATAIKTDPDLKDKIPQSIDKISAVKTITTDDGHEIKIHGNEDDGFRISIKNKDAKTTFRDLDEATMAVEMYCARRRQQMENADYIEEKR